MANYTILNDADRNWGSVDMWNEIASVANQIASVCGDAQRLPSVDGRNSGSAVSSNTYWTIYDLQRLIFDNFTKFVPTNTVIEGIVDSAIPSNYSSWTTFLSNAGMSTDGFRRVEGKDWPTNWTNLADAEYTFGYAEDGDVIGPWNWHDIQLAFDEMSVMLKLCSWSDPTGVGAGSKGDGDNGIDWNTAKANGRAAYLADSIIGAGSNNPSGLGQGVYPTGVPDLQYGASYFVDVNVAKLDILATETLNAEVKYYQEAEPQQTGAGHVFDDNGQDIINGQMHLWSTVTDDISALVYSGLLGSFDTPNDSADPISDNLTTASWIAREPYALITLGLNYTL